MLLNNKVLLFEYTFPQMELWYSAVIYSLKILLSRTPMMNNDENMRQNVCMASCFLVMVTLDTRVNQQSRVQYKQHQENMRDSIHYFER